jgi:hypothetical protein
MPKRLRTLTASFTAAAVAAGAYAAQAATPAAPALTAAQSTYLAQHMVNVRTWRPRFLTKPPAVNGALRARAFIGAPGGVTVPYWTTQITSPLDKHTYTVSMVGSSPYALHPANTNITYVPVVIRIHLKGFVIDPTQISHCDTQSAANRFFHSPLFVPNTFVSNGVNVSNVQGGTQLISAFQRANFWNAVKNTSYGVTLVPSQQNPIVVDWSPTNPSDFVGGVHDNCGHTSPVPFVEINEFDAELQAIAATYATPRQIPVSLALNTAIYIGTTDQCCVLGYHNAVPVEGGTQLYAVGAYFDTINAFGPHFADTTIWSHELAELTDDPFVQSIPTVPGGYNNDLTPAWGNTGQVYGCQNNLEAGDPLTPDQNGNYPNYAVTGVGGFVYHYQDLPFHDWFYRTPSSSTGGRGSFVGNFGAGQPTICQ